MKLFQNNGVVFKITSTCLALFIITLAVLIYFVFENIKVNNNIKTKTVLSTVFQTIQTVMDSEEIEVNKALSNLKNGLNQDVIKKINIIDIESKQYLFSSDPALRTLSVSEGIIKIIENNSFENLQFIPLKILENDKNISVLSISAKQQWNDKTVFTQLFLAETSFFQKSQQLSQPFIFLIIFALILFLIAIYLISSQYSILIKSIAHIIQKFSNSIYNFKLPERKDEFGLIKQNLVQLSETLQVKDQTIKEYEKEKHDQNKIIVQDKDNYQIDVALCNIQLKNVDLISENLTSNTVMKINNLIHNMVDNEINIFSGELLNFFNSNFIIIFRGEKRIERAVNFSLKIKMLFDSFISENQLQINEKIDFCGVIHTGIIHYSKFSFHGTEKKIISGKHKMVMEQILKNASSGEILISENIKNEIQKNYGVKKSLNNIEITGVEDIQIFELQGTKESGTAEEQNLYTEDINTANAGIGGMLEQTFSSFD